MIDVRNDRLLTTEEVARFFSVKPLTIREWVRIGKLNAKKVNGYWRIPESEVTRLAQEMYGA